MLRASSSSLLLVLPLVIAAAGCPGPSDGAGGEGEGEGEAGEGEGEGDAGEGEGEGEGEEPAEGEGEEPPPPPPANDTCAAAEAIVSGTPKSGTTLGAFDDTPCADGDFDVDENGGDVAYALTLDAEQGLRVTVDSDDIDAVVSVFSDSGCGAGGVSVDDRTCMDATATGGSEEILIGSLQPGTYFIVVESYFEAGDFTLTADVIDPFCVGDALDREPGNETAETASSFLPGNIAALNQNVDTAAEDTALDLQLCDGDVDYFLVGHLGGDLSLTVTGEGAVAEVRAAVVDVEASIAASVLTYEEGDVVDGLPGAAVAVPAGYYLVRLTEDQELSGSASVGYDVALTHQCEGDDFDIADAELDAFFERQQDPIVLPLDAPLERVICGADVDLVLLNVLFEGQVALVFSGDVGRDITLDLFSVAEDGTETPVEATRIDDETANTLTFTAEVLPGDLVARVSGPGIVNSGAYSVDVVLPGLSGAPVNDGCADAVVLQDGVAAGGRTVGAASDAVGACNFEDEENVAADVFFRFTLDAELPTEVRLSPLVGYDGGFALYRLGAEGCPADLADLELVQLAEDVDACVGPFDDTDHLRAVLPAGDYLVAVEDSSFGAPGVFEVAYETFADGFPPLPVCAAAEEIALPDVGASTTTTIQPGDLTEVDTEAIAWGDCAFFPDLGEKAFRFTPSTTVRVTVSAAAQTPADGSDPWDSVVAIFEGGCTEGVGPVVCNDNVSDDFTDLDSSVTATLDAGVEYTLVVDGYTVFDFDTFEFSAPTAGLDLTISVEAP